MNDASPMRAAVIGCGFQGRLHVENLVSLPGIEVVVVCDTAPERAEALAAEFGVPHWCTAYDQALDDSIDLVSVCTMPNTHREITVLAAGHGSHVLCEKPMATSAAEAADMVEAAEQHGVRLGIGFNMRFTDSARVIRAHCTSGELGRLVCARTHMLADDVPWWGRHYDRSVSGGGALAATAVHMLDLVWWLAGKPRPLTATASTTTLFPGKRGHGAPSAEARALYSVEDLVFGHIRFEGGFWMSVEGAWVWDQPGWNYGFDLVGDRAQARFEPLEIRGERGGALTHLYGPVQAANDFPTSVAAEVEAFVESIRWGTESDVAAGRDGLVVQSVVDAMYASAASGHEVEVQIPEMRGGPR
jgi:predicted dehydrogenase